MDLETLRTALLISLSVLLVVVLYQRFRRGVRANDLPVARHAELRSLAVAYHPARLLVEVRVPEMQRLMTGLSQDDRIRDAHQWPDEAFPAGTHRFERPLPALEPGEYHFELRTTTQRTVRRFRLQP
ncbi:MAG: hypothetical protein IPM46_16230 [Flavobacteriales bacterium]|nr:hypothetical protein [Flavobacteriales bacterium]